MASIGPRFREALAYAARLHEGQWRKRSGDDLPWIPYLSHLLGVASLVLEVDGDEDEAVAALLHDAAEDHPRGGATEREIGERFGPRVLEIVRSCTKPEIDEDGPADLVRARRQRQARDYIDGFGPAGPSVKLVAVADKLHNARSIVSDLREHGPLVWDRFSKTGDETLGYYRELVEALRGGDERSRRLVDELGRTVDEMHRLAGQPLPASPGGSA